MLRNILVPTDGSAPSQRAIREAAALARRLGCGMVGIHVITPFQGYAHHRSRPGGITAAEFEEDATAAAQRHLSAVTKAAAARRVSCRCHAIWDTSAADAIVKAARVHRCGLIVMATHGRSGLPRLLLGSVTQNVLARSRVPVVVCR